MDDPALNELMTQAFSPVAAGPEQAPAEQKTEKDPTDTTLPLPAAISDDKKLDKGHMKWTLKPENHSSARADIDFKPDETKVEAKTVSFGQTVVSHVGSSFAYAGGTANDPGKNKAKFEPFEEAATKKRMDHAVDTENDPFYGAEWDQARQEVEAGAIRLDDRVLQEGHELHVRDDVRHSQRTGGARGPRRRVAPSSRPCRWCSRPASRWAR